MESDNSTFDDLVIWRYLTLDRFEPVLAGQLYFAAATQFDTFEGSITEAQYARRRIEAARVFPEATDSERLLESATQAFADLRRMMKINCWNASEHENVAMWERYLQQGSCGVAIKSSVGSLKAAIRPFRLAPTYGEEHIIVRRVKYLDYSTQDFAGSMEAPFFYKRSSFEMNEKSALYCPCVWLRSSGSPSRMRASLCGLTQGD